MASAFQAYRQTGNVEACDLPGVAVPPSTPANIGRRRAVPGSGSSLLESPSRLGHRDRMAQIFTEAGSAMQKQKENVGRSPLRLLSKGLPSWATPARKPKVCNAPRSQRSMDIVSPGTSIQLSIDNAIFDEPTTQDVVYPTLPSFDGDSDTVNTPSSSSKTNPQPLKTPLHARPTGIKGIVRRPPSGLSMGTPRRPPPAHIQLNTLKRSNKVLIRADVLTDLAGSTDNFSKTIDEMAFDPIKDGAYRSGRACGSDAYLTEEQAAEPQPSKGLAMDRYAKPLRTPEQLKSSSSRTRSSTVPNLREATTGRGAACDTRSTPTTPQRAKHWSGDISTWLAHVNMTPPTNEDDDIDEDGEKTPDDISLAPLSPDVQLHRGTSAQRRRREEASDGNVRCASYFDRDILKQRSPGSAWMGR